MSVLPSYHGRDQELQYLFKLIDERLSEALSIHGRQTLRQGTKLFDTTSKTPETDQTYSANTLFAWAYSSPNVAANSVSIISGVNLTVERLGTGNYRYKFINSPKYSVISESPQLLSPTYAVLPFVIGPWGAVLPGIAMVHQTAGTVDNLNLPGHIYVSSLDINSFELTSISTNTYLFPATPPTWTLNDITHGVIVLASA